jgi:prepilin-type N-terminal cleavage/methylation domain-containing protein
MKMHHRSPKGYTLIELLVVVSVTTFGLIALLQLQIGTLHSAAATRDMQIAINLAEHAAQSMRLEALQWSSNSQPISNTNFHFLKNAPVIMVEGQSSEWLNAYKPTGGTQDWRVGPVGNNADYDEGILTEIPETSNQNFCVHYRLTWLVPDLLLRADIRVTWSKNKAQHLKYMTCPVEMESVLSDNNSITFPASIMKNIFVKQVSL